MNIKDLLHSIRNFLLTTNIQGLIIAPILVGFCLMTSVLLIEPTYTGAPAQNILISLGAICWAISGIPKVIRQESVYGPIRLYGALAILDGIITIGFSLTLAVIPIIVWNR